MKTKEEDSAKKLRKLKKYYIAADEELHLSEHDVVEQVHMLVDICDQIQGEICRMSDDIKIDDLSKVQELTPIDKTTYLEFVKICTLKNNGKLKDKTITKFTDDFYRRLFIANLRHSFINSYLDNSDLKITDEDNEEYTPFVDYKSDEFTAIMENSATKRDYLNNVLYKRYKNFAKAAEYITNLELDYKTFKNLVDWQHYKDGGYPAPNSPSKIWAIFDKFNYAYRTLSKWNYIDTANELNYEFGLQVETGEQHPVEHVWMRSSDENID